jgi:hypothetical protein
LLVNSEAVALNKDVPVIEMVDSETFKTREDLKDDTYYYVYDVEERYITETDLNKYKDSLN